MPQGQEAQKAHPQVEEAGEEAVEEKVQEEKPCPYPQKPGDPPEYPHVGVAEGHQAHQKALPLKFRGGKEGQPVEEGEEGEEAP